MIKCPKCQADNQIGAIFCRSCGDKLDIDKLRPDDIKKATRNRAKLIGRIIRNVISLILLLAIVGGAVLMALAPPGDWSNTLNDAESKERNKKIVAIMRRVKQLDVDFKFNQRELNAYATEVLRLTSEDKRKRQEEQIEEGGKAMLVPEAVRVDLLADGRLRFVLESRLWNKISLYTVVTGSANSGTDFRIEQVAAGRLPIPVQRLTDILIEKRFRPLMQNSSKYEKFKKRVAPNADKIVVENGELKIKSKKKR